ncbi:MAG: hypothetical protein JW734_02870 [Candidatus Omnitrophica bacterium]|nr:hypothetical protein [Candidatus Omnitrophota bacterium]
MKKKILILYITHLSGHHRAAKAIERSLKILDENCQVVCLDSLKQLHTYSSGIINFLYSFVIQKASFIWRSIYDKKSVIRTLNPVKNLIHFSNLKKIEKLIKEFRPDAVVCTQAFPCGVVSFFKKRKNNNFPLIAAITDLWPHGFWFYKEVDYYIVSSDWCKARFEALAVPQEKIKIFGIPIMPEFSRPIDLEASARQFKINLNLPRIIIMGGGSGLGPLREIALALDGSNLNFQIIVICGKNKKLQEWFSNKNFKKPFHIFGYTEEVYKIMSFSDIIITKPGGITVSESLSKGLATIVFKPIPGQEENNLRFLLNEKLVLQAHTPGQVKFFVEDLLKNNEKLQYFRARGLSYAKPRSSLDIAQLVLNSIK